jgi:hypothetical protein
MSRVDGVRARLVSGPLGRGVAFAADFTVALAQGLRRKFK